MAQLLEGYAGVAAGFAEGPELSNISPTTTIQQ